MAIDGLTPSLVLMTLSPRESALKRADKYAHLGNAHLHYMRTSQVGISDFSLFGGYVLNMHTRPKCACHVSPYSGVYVKYAH